MSAVAPVPYYLNPIGAIVNQCVDAKETCAHEKEVPAVATRLSMKT
ncbi:MAG: hypothetical protein ACXV4C_07280 [Halobacteriota archaeon]